MILVNANVPESPTKEDPAPALTPRGTIARSDGSPRTTGSRVGTGTKSVIEVQVSDLITDALHAAKADPLITSEQLGDFLADSLWQVLLGAMAATGVEMSPDAGVARAYCELVKLTSWSAPIW